MAAMPAMAPVMEQVQQRTSQEQEPGKESQGVKAMLTQQVEGSDAEERPHRDPPIAIASSGGWGRGSHVDLREVTGGIACPVIRVSRDT